MERKIIMVTGGQRSGKSEFAEKLIKRMTDSPVYLATAEILDDEMRRRVEIHRNRRGEEWTNIDSQFPERMESLEGKTVLVDCVTMWASNIFFSCGEDGEKSLERFKKDFESLISTETDFIFVTNEIGLGGVSDNAMRRHFTDLQGYVNRIVAEKADEVYLMVSGLELKIK